MIALLRLHLRADLRTRLLTVLVVLTLFTIGMTASTDVSHALLPMAVFLAAPALIMLVTGYRTTDRMTFLAPVSRGRRLMVSWILSAMASFVAAIVIASLMEIDKPYGFVRMVARVWPVAAIVVTLMSIIGILSQHQPDRRQGFFQLIPLGVGILALTWMHDLGKPLSFYLWVWGPVLAFLLALQAGIFKDVEGYSAGSTAEGLVPPSPYWPGAEVVEEPPPFSHRPQQSGTLDRSSSPKNPVLGPSDSAPATILYRSRYTNAGMLLMTLTLAGAALFPGFYWNLLFCSLSVTLMDEHLKLWAPFQATPFPRKRAFIILMKPMLIFWACCALLRMGMTWQWENGHFVSLKEGSVTTDRYKLLIPERLGYDPRFEVYETSQARSQPFVVARDLPWDRAKAAELLSSFLEAAHGVRVTPTELINLHPGGLIIDDYDVGQGAWIKALHQRFRVDILVHSAWRRAVEASLVLLVSLVLMLISFLSALPGWAGRVRRGFLFLLILAPNWFLQLHFRNDNLPDRVTTWIESLIHMGDRHPSAVALGILVLVGLLLRHQYRKFRSWSPGGRVEPSI